jgi:hypothetical protein
MHNTTAEAGAPTRGPGRAAGSEAEKRKGLQQGLWSKGKIAACQAVDPSSSLGSLSVFGFLPRCLSTAHSTPQRHTTGPRVTSNANGNDSKYT